MKKLNYFGLLCICSLAGCANQFSVYRPLDTSQGQGALIDIKQRAIVVTKRGADTVVCAEPSPDAMAAYAAELSANIKNAGGATAELTANTREAAAYIGYRTSSIQLLRDSMYRNCEAYASGAIEKAEYALLLRRDQRYMAALLGIESLSQVKGSSSLSIGTTNAPAKDSGSSASTDSTAGTDAKAKAAGAAPSKPSVDTGSNANTNGSAAATVETVQAIKEIVFKLVEFEDSPALCFNVLTQSSVKPADEVRSYCNFVLSNIVTHNQKVEVDMAACNAKPSEAEKAACKKNVSSKLGLFNVVKPIDLGNSK